MNLTRPTLALALLLTACGGSPDSSTDAETSDTAGGEAAAGYGLPNERRLDTGLVTGGHPSPEALEAATADGVTTVISLQTAEEDGVAEEAAQAEALGLRYVSIPVAGADGVTEDNARALDEALAGLDPSQTIVHCASGNRAGALLALRAFYLEGRTRTEALALGRAAGLTGLEDAVAAHFGAHCADQPAATQC